MDLLYWPYHFTQCPMHRYIIVWGRGVNTYAVQASKILSKKAWGYSNHNDHSAPRLRDGLMPFSSLSIMVPSAGCFESSGSSRGLIRQLDSVRSVLGQKRHRVPNLYMTAALPPYPRRV